MGTQVYFKGYLPGYYPMRDLNEDSNSGSWPLFYGDKNLSNGQYYTGFMPRTIADAYPGCDKNALKQKMLEHEAIFRNQVYELHRLYRIQRDMMEEIKRKDLHRHRASIEPSSSSSLLGSQVPSEDTRKWHVTTYPLTNSGYARSTVSGADIVNSPLSCTKGNNTLASRVTSQNGSASKDCEVLEARPSKVRKKLFDLQLPADEYIDTEDAEPRDTKISGISSFTPNGEYKFASERSMKLSLGGVAVGKTGGCGEAFTCDSHLRSSVGLADLNEPVEVEELTGPSSIDIFGNSANNGGVKGIDLSAKPNSGLLSVQKEVIERSHQGSQNGFFNNLSIENKVNERVWLSYKYEAGHGKSNLSSVSKGLQRDKLPLPSTQAHNFNQAHSPTIHLNDHSKEDLCRERAGWGLEESDRSRNYSNNSHLESVMASRVPTPYPFVGTSDVASTWPQFVSSWGKPAGGLTQKLASFHTHPSLISSSSLSKSLQSSAQSYDVLGDKWNVNSRCRLNPGLGTDPASHNGFYPGSSSGSKDLPVCFPSVDFNYLNGSRSDNIASEHLINHGLEKSQKGSNYIEQKPSKDMNLNVAFLNNLLNEAVPRQDLEIIDERSKCEDHQAVLPWLRAKPASKSEGTNSMRDANSVGSGFLHASPNSFFGKTEIVKDLNQMFIGSSASNNHEITPKEETSETHGGRKILGFPIFEKVSASRNDSSSLVSSTATLHPTLEGETVKHEVKNRVIDINVACDASLLESGDEPAAEEMVMEKPLAKNSTCVRNFIDLNSCVTEDEDPPVPSVASNVASVKVVMEIDLEALPVPEAEEDILPKKENEQETDMRPPDHKMEQAEDAIVRNAAEAIVDISSSCQPVNLENSTCHPSDASLAESLLWFADVATFSADEFENKSGKETKGRNGAPVKGAPSEEMDDFEAITLQLPETKEEDYLPKPFIPEVQKVEETGTKTLPTRTRRGQARRGRQRRDFQRDILPGLASLSRHEVTEDLQTFGGLMRATGHSWNSGLTRRNGTRNGGTRGRRRTVVETASADAPSAVCTPLVQQLKNTETCLEDRSLTGWGKTPRRPRRQRCPAGNPPTVPST